MELSRHSPAPSRFTGLGVVVAVHLVAVWALCVAFVRTPGPAQQPPTVRPIPEQPHWDPPPPVRPAPRLTDLPVERIAAPDVVDTLPPPVDRAPVDTGPSTAVTLIGGSGAADPTPAAVPTQKATAALNGPVCVDMPRPEAPAVNWTGNAVLQAIATVQAGRVVGTEIRVVQGSMDPRTRRALTHAVEAALAGYRCPGDQRFQQEFSFRID